MLLGVGSFQFQGEPRNCSVSLLARLASEHGPFLGADGSGGASGCCLGSVF